MAGRGPAPKPVLQRESRTAARIEASTKLTDDGQVRGPDLPDGDWNPRTIAWWETWRRSPQAKAFTATDWDSLSEAALLHTRLWNGEMTVAAELRLRVAKFGATIEDRMRLKMLIDGEAAEVQKAAPPVPMDRRQRLMRVVNGAS